MYKQFDGKMKLYAMVVSLILVAVLTLSVAGCDNGEDLDTDVTEQNGTNADDDQEEPADVVNELIIGLGRDFHYGPEDRTFLHGSTNVWESLTYLDENLQAVPELAESFSSSEDGTVWTFKIREGVLFHDGEELNATSRST